MILRWHLQRGIVVIPKSSSVDHQKENKDIYDFQLSEEDINYLNSMNQNKRIVNKLDFLGYYDIFA